MHISPSVILALAAFAFCNGCAAPAPFACPAPRAGAARSAKVFFATDRKQDRSVAAPKLDFGRQRSEPPRLSLGWEQVALGPAHRLGRVDKAVALTPIWNVAEEAGGTPGDALRKADAEMSTFVSTDLRAAIRRTPPTLAGGRRRVLLFIHGYNNTFDDAVRKTAQLAGDLEMVACDGAARGVQIAYSWPAQGTLLSYLADEENTEWTQQRLTPFLRALAEVCRQERADLHLIAHSMGSRAIVRSIADLSNASGLETRGGEKPFRHLVLLAPDIGKGIFDQYVERILPQIGHVTIYVSAKDRALSISSLLHGGNYRLGFIESTLRAALQVTGLFREDHRSLGYFPTGSAGEGIDMIDVSGGLADPLGHSYEDPAFVRDLRELLAHDTPAGTGARENLERRKVKPGILASRTSARQRYFRLKTQ